MPYFDPFSESLPYTFKRSTGVGSGTPTKLCGTDPRRVALVFTNMTNFWTAITTQTGGGTSSPNFLAPNGRPFILKWEDVGPLVSQELWFFQTDWQDGVGGAQQFGWCLTEILYQPTRT